MIFLISYLNTRAEKLYRKYFFLKLKAKLDYSTVFRPSHCIEENGMGKYSKAKDFPNL